MRELVKVKTQLICLQGAVLNLLLKVFIYSSKNCLKLTVSAPSSLHFHVDYLAQRTRSPLRRALNSGRVGDRKSMARLYASFDAVRAAAGSSWSVAMDFSSGEQSDFVIEAAMNQTKMLK